MGWFSRKKPTKDTTEKWVSRQQSKLTGREFGKVHLHDSREEAVQAVREHLEWQLITFGSITHAAEFGWIVRRWRKGNDAPQLTEDMIAQQLEIEP